MPPGFAPAVYPVPDRYIDAGKEPQPGTVAAATVTLPMTQFKPEDKITYLEDTAWRNAMAQLYNLIQGVEISELSLGGPFFGDTFGHILTGLMGDYYQFVVGGSVGTVSSLNGATTVGATTIVLASGTISTGAVISIGGTATTAEEVRKVTANNNGTVTLNAALYQAHGNGSTVISYLNYTGIQHTWALLNQGLGAGGATESQPPTYTLYDFTDMPAVSGARQYSFTSFSEASLTCEATGLVMFDSKATALASVIAASTPTVAISAVAPQPAWNSTVTIGGAGTNNVAEWKLTLTRKLAPKFTNQGTQTPFYIAKGYFTAGLSFNFDPASDELEYNYFRNNTQPSLVLQANNGLAGSAAVVLTVNANQCAMDTSALEDGKDVFGFNNTAKLVANTTNIGPSGGFGPCTIQIQNAVINY